VGGWSTNWPAPAAVGAPDHTSGSAAPAPAHERPLTGDPMAASATTDATAAARPPRRPPVEPVVARPVLAPPPKKLAMAYAPAMGHPVTPKPQVHPQLQVEPPDLRIGAEQWKVTTTSNASYFNLGGHVDKAGVVDSMASSHLREAFRSHKNFEKLPNHIKVHINTQNIDLSKIAPYRTLLGIDDKKLEQEQGVKFERIARNR
jgi:hypothetical protein